MKKLLEGILEFRVQHLQSYRERYEKMVSGQAPDVLFIACSDSRVVPNLFASTDPGELFVVRNMGNMIPPYSKKFAEQGHSEFAEIEHALTNLPIEHIVICGHSECSAMHTLASNQQTNGSVAQWLKNCGFRMDDHEIDANVQIKGDYFTSLSLINKMSQINILQQIKHVKTHPLIAQKISSQNLKIHGWYFDLKTADIYTYREKSSQFILISED